MNQTPKLCIPKIDECILTGQTAIHCSCRNDKKLSTFRCLSTCAKAFWWKIINFLMLVDKCKSILIKNYRLFDVCRQVQKHFDGKLSTFRCLSTSAKAFWWKIIDFSMFVDMCENILMESYRLFGVCRHVQKHFDKKLSTFWCLSISAKTFWLKIIQFHNQYFNFLSFKQKRNDEQTILHFLLST